MSENHFRSRSPDVHSCVRNENAAHAPRIVGLMPVGNSANNARSNSRIGFSRSPHSSLFTLDSSLRAHRRGLTHFTCEKLRVGSVGETSFTTVRRTLYFVQMSRCS